MRPACVGPPPDAWASWTGVLGLGQWIGEGARVRLEDLLVALLVAAALAAPAVAQVVCRKNALGAEICMGLPAPSLRGREPYTAKPPGLGSVQPPARPAGGPELTPARRTDALGNTFLEASELPPDRPLPGVAGTRNCRRDALGNLICQ